MAGADSAKDVMSCRLLVEKARQTHNECDILSMEQATLAIDQLWHIDLPHLEQKATALIDRAEKINCHPIITFANVTLGDYYYYDHNYILAFEYYLRAYNDYHTLYKNEFPDMSSTQFTLAAAYYKFNDYKNSLKYSKELVGNDLSKKIYLAIFINDLIGTSYLKLHQYDSAIVYYKKTLALAPMHHSPKGAIAWAGIATGKIGVALYEQNKYDAAIPYLEQGVELTTKGYVPDNIATFAVYLSNIYQARQNTDAAFRYLQIARDATYKANTLQNYSELYTALSAFYRKAGNTSLTLKYLDSSMTFKDSLAGIIDVNKKYTAEMSVIDERRNINEKLAEKEKQKQILIRNGLIIIVIMAMLFTLLFYNRKLLKQQYRKEQLLAEKKISDAELAIAVQQLDNYKNNIDEKNNLIATLEKEISNSYDNTTITRLQQSTILTDEQWENFRQLFEKAHPGFLQKLKEKLPGLTPAETRLMVLAKLSFTTKEMAAALGVSAQAMRTTWYRMRKKLNLPEEGSLEELVENI